MTNNQLQILRAALTSPEIRDVLTKLRLQVAEADVEACPQYSNVLQLKSRAHQIQNRERVFAQAVALKDHDDLLLLGNTPAIEGFSLKGRHLVQFKGVGEDKPDPPPGLFVQAFLDAWQRARGWSGIWLYVDAAKITVEFARQRWNTAGTQPKLEPIHLNNQISHGSVRCSNGWTDLPLQLATPR